MADKLTIEETIKREKIKRRRVGRPDEPEPGKTRRGWRD